MDSFMFQTVGVEITDYISQCLEVPIVKREITGRSLNQDLYYEMNEEQKENDEVEDLLQLIISVKTQFPEVQAVASGAIYSNYQRLRVENVCQRLGMASLAYLWLRDQSELLNEMIECQLDARIAKICSMGLKVVHLGKGINELQQYFATLKDKFEFNVCGEGGEYESAVFDCPLFRNKKILLRESEIIHHSENEIGPVAYLHFKEMEIVEKDEQTKLEHAQILADLIESRRLQDSEAEESKSNLTSKQESSVQISCSLSPTTVLQITTKRDQISTKLLRVADFSDFEGEPTQERQLDFLLKKTDELLSSQGMSLRKNAIKVILYIGDMSQFGQLNQVYKQFFGIKPPVRVCVELPTGSDQQQSSIVQIQVLAISTEAINQLNRQNLHVQSFSKWAPANIGPYSQANQLKDHIFLAGNIGLIPELMTLKLTLREQYDQILFNFNQILKTLAKTSIAESFVRKSTNFQPLGAVVFVSPQVNLDHQLFSMLNEQFAMQPTIILKVQKLPRDALIEIEIHSSLNQNQSVDTLAEGLTKLTVYRVTDEEESPEAISKCLANIADHQQQEESQDIDLECYTGQIQAIENLEESFTQHLQLLRADRDQNTPLHFTVYLPATLIIVSGEQSLVALLQSLAPEHSTVDLVRVIDCRVLSQIEGLPKVEDESQTVIWTALSISVL